MTVTFEPLDDIGEVSPGDDIAALIAQRTTVTPGDVVVVTSKIVSKAAGLATSRSKDELLNAETDRIVAQRGTTSIVRTHHGLTMAAAGIDNSNTFAGALIPLPPDPDASAAAIRDRLLEYTGALVAVIVSDTAGRAWRVGQTDIAIGCAGLTPFESFEGRHDPYGNQLAVTSPAVADEIAGGAELASGKFGGRPIVIVRGLEPKWFTKDNGPGAAALIREESADMFGLGSREAAVAAILNTQPVRGLPPDTSMTINRLVDLALTDLPLSRSTVTVDGVEVGVNPPFDRQVAAGQLVQRLTSLGVAHGITITVRVNTDRA